MMTVTLGQFAIRRRPPPRPRPMQPTQTRADHQDVSKKMSANATRYFGSGATTGAGVLASGSEVSLAVSPHPGQMARSPVRGHVQRDPAKGTHLRTHEDR